MDSDSGRPSRRVTGRITATGFDPSSMTISAPAQRRARRRVHRLRNPSRPVDTSQRLRHTIQFVDESTPTSRAKPDGVAGCEVWVKVGDPAPADAGALKYLATDTRTRLTRLIMTAGMPAR